MHKTISKSPVDIILLNKYSFELFLCLLWLLKAIDMTLTIVPQNNEDIQCVANIVIVDMTQEGQIQKILLNSFKYHSWVNRLYTLSRFELFRIQL